MNTLKENQSYQLNCLQVHEFSGKRDRAFGASTTLIDDLEDILKIEDVTQDEPNTLVNVLVTGVNQLRIFAIAYIAKRNFLQPTM